MKYRCTESVDPISGLKTWKNEPIPESGSDNLRGKNQKGQLRAMNSDGSKGSNGDGGEGKPGRSKGYH